MARIQSIIFSASLSFLACLGGPGAQAADPPEADIRGPAMEPFDVKELLLAVQTLGLGEVGISSSSKPSEQQQTDDSIRNEPSSDESVAPAISDHSQVSVIKWVGITGAVIFLMRTFRRR